MPVSDANKRNLRLPRELAGRLKKEAAAQGISENDYLIIAATQKLDADEARRKQQGGDAPKHRREREAPRGLGLRLEPLVRPEPAPALEPVAPVVVQVNGAGATAPATSGELVAGLVAHLAGKPLWERERLRQQARDILKSNCPTGAAYREAEQQMEQALKEALEQRAERRAPAYGGQIGSLFR